MSADRKDDIPVNYLADYREDRFADRHLLEPILFNESNIAQVEIISEVQGWNQSVIDRYAGNRRGISYHKYLVKCPKHEEFFQLIEDEPRPWSYKCRCCITDEIDRVINARFIRDSDFWRSMRGKGGRQ